MRLMETELSTDQLAQVKEQERSLLKSRRPWYYLAILLLLVGVLLRMPLLLLTGVFTLLVGFIPEIWFRSALRHIIVRQQVNYQHLFFGEQVTLSISIENRKLLPLPWLQVEDVISPPLTATLEKTFRLQDIQHDTLISTWLIWPFQRVTRRYRMHCHARGFHVFGPIKLYCSDPFGWLERDLYLATNTTLLVYPLVAPIELLGLPASLPMGERVGPRKLLEDPLWFAGNREYQLGDDPRRIDWKATARVGELRSKIYESTTIRRLLVVLDTWAYSNTLKGVDFEVQEFCISVAASLAVWALDEGYMVGLLANSSLVTTANDISSEADTDQIKDPTIARQSNATKISPPGVSVEFSLDPEQYEQILTTLACLVPGNNGPIEHFIETEEAMFPQGTTILLIGSAETLSRETIEMLQEKRLHGNSVNLVLVGDGEAGKVLPTEHDLPLHYVGGKEKWHEIIRTVNASGSEALGISATGIELD